MRSACKKLVRRRIRTLIDSFRLVSTKSLKVQPLSYAARVRQAARDITVVLAPEEKRFDKFIGDLASSDTDPESRYSVTINVELRFLKTSTKDATLVKFTNNPNAPAVRLTDEQIRDRYPLEYSELVRRCKERYADFKVDEKFHGLRRGLKTDPQSTHVRYLDPANPSSSKKLFHSVGMLDKFDAHYQRKT